MRRLRNNQREIYVFISIREARFAFFWDPSAETSGANGYTIANLFRLHAQHPLPARTTLCLNALERRLLRLGLCVAVFSFSLRATNHLTLL